MRLGGRHQLEEAAGDHGEAVVEAGIGHDHIEAAEGGAGLLDQQPAVSGSERSPSVTSVLAGLAAGVVVRGMHQDSHARARQASGDGRADALSRAGHQN